MGRLYLPTLAAGMRYKIRRARRDARQFPDAGRVVGDHRAGATSPTPAPDLAQKPAT